MNTHPEIAYALRRAAGHRAWAAHERATPALRRSNIEVARMWLRLARALRIGPTDA